MKKIYIFGLLALSAIAMVSCKEQGVDKELSQSIQKERETLTQAETYLWGDFYESEISNVVSLALASKNVSFNYDGVPFSSFDGTGYAFNIVLYTSLEGLYPAAGVYTADKAEVGAPFTYDMENTYINVLNGGNLTKLLIDTAAITVAVEGEAYTITVNALTIGGATVKGTYKGQLEGKNPFAFRESTQASEIVLEAAAVSYEADEANYADWANDSVYSYYAEEYASYAEYYAFLAEQAYQDKDTATGDEYMGYAEEYAYYSDYYASEAVYYTPLNAHYFTLVTETGDVLNLEIDLERLDPEFTEVIPDGKYLAAYGTSWIENINDLWSADAWKVYGSYLQTADGQVYYIDEAQVTVKMSNEGVAEMIQVKGSTINGSSIEVNYGIDE